MAALGPQHEVVAAERHDARLRRARRSAPRGGRRGRLRRRPPARPRRLRRRSGSRSPPRVARDRATSRPSRSTPPAARTSSANASATRPKSTTDVSGECSACTPATWGSSSCIRSGPISSAPGTPFASERAVELLEPWDLRVVGGDDDLPAAQDRDPALVTVGEHPRRALDAEPRLERAGRVVDAAVDDAARMARLVRPTTGSLSSTAMRAPGRRCLELARGREADDARADDGDVEPRGAHERPAATRCPASVRHDVPLKPSMRLRSGCTRGRSRPRAASAGRPWR